AHREGVDAATQGAVARAGAEELRIGAPRQFVESLVDDVIDCALNEVATVVGHFRAVLVGAFAQNLDARSRQLRIGRHVDEHLLMEWNRAVGLRRRRGTRRERREVGLLSWSLFAAAQSPTATN